MSTRYDDFDLVFRKSGEHYVVQLINSPTGQAEGAFELPFTDGEMRKFYGRIGQLSRSMRSANSPGMDAAKQFGGKLFDAVFQGELLGRLRASSDTLRGTNRGLRLRLRLRDAPALAELPWEFLYDREQDHFLATSTMTPMVRYLDMAQRAAPLKVHLPLRILVVIAGPKNLQALDAEGEWERLSLSLKALESTGVIVLERLQGGTLDALRRRAGRDPFHILHFVGHGSFDPIAGDGCLHFEDDKGMSDPVQGSFLGNILRDHASLRLVVLNACEGARQSTEDPFSGVAQSLCQQQMPAVIAMQFEISDDAAKRFAEEFYAAVADCVPVDAAVAASRKSMFNGRFGQEWATPVLYMRSPDGLLFDVRKRVAHPAVVAGVGEDKRRADEAARVAAEVRVAAEARAAAEETEARVAAEARREEAAKARQAVEAAEAEKAAKAEEEHKAAYAASALEAAAVIEAGKTKQAAADQVRAFFENIDRTRAAKAAAEAEHARLAEAARMAAERKAAEAIANRQLEEQAARASAEAERKRQIAAAEKELEAKEKELAAAERKLGEPKIPPPPPIERQPMVERGSPASRTEGPGSQGIAGVHPVGQEAAAANDHNAEATKAQDAQETPKNVLLLVAVAFGVIALAFVWGVVVEMTTAKGLVRGLLPSLLLSVVGGVVARVLWRAARARWLVWLGFPVFAVAFIAGREGFDWSFSVAFLSMVVMGVIALGFGAKPRA